MRMLLLLLLVTSTATAQHMAISAYSGGAYNNNPDIIYNSLSSKIFTSNSVATITRITGVRFMYAVKKISLGVGCDIQNIYFKGKDDSVKLKFYYGKPSITTYIIFKISVYKNIYSDILLGYSNNNTNGKKSDYKNHVIYDEGSKGLFGAINIGYSAKLNKKISAFIEAGLRYKYMTSNTQQTNSLAQPTDEKIYYKFYSVPIIFGLTYQI